MQRPRRGLQTHREHTGAGAPGPTWPGSKAFLFKTVKTTDMASLTVQDEGQAEGGQANARKDNTAMQGETNARSMVTFSSQQPLHSHSASPALSTRGLPEPVTPRRHGVGGLRVCVPRSFLELSRSRLVRPQVSLAQTSFFAGALELCQELWVRQLSYAPELMGQGQVQTWPVGSAPWSHKAHERKMRSCELGQVRAGRNN